MLWIEELKSATHPLRMAPPEMLPAPPDSRWMQKSLA